MTYRQTSFQNLCIWGEHSRSLPPHNFNVPDFTQFCHFLELHTLLTVMCLEVFGGRYFWGNKIFNILSKHLLDHPSSDLRMTVSSMIYFLNLGDKYLLIYSRLNAANINHFIYCLFQTLSLTSLFTSSIPNISYIQLLNQT